MDDVRPIARCENCGCIIYDDNKNVYVNDNGEYFCELSCVFEFYGIRPSEDCMVTDNGWDSL